MLDAMNDAVEPAGAFAAGGALAAGFFKVKISESLSGLYHAGVFVHHDHRTRAEHRAGFGDGVVIHIGGHHYIAFDNRHGGTTGNDRLDFLAAAHAAGHFEERCERCAELHFVIARPHDIARHRK